MRTISRGEGKRIRRLSAAVVLVLAVGSGVATARGGGPAGPLTTAGFVATTGPSVDPGVWVSAPDGSGRHRITPTGETWFSDDVSRGHPTGPVTVVAGTGAPSNRQRLYAIRADGAGSPVLLYEAAAPARVLQGRFSHDGARMAFIANTGVQPIVYSIFVADVLRDGAGEVTGLANVVHVYDTGSQLFRGLDFSRDGSRIVFVMAHDLWSLDLANGGVTRLTATAEVEAFPRCSSTDARVVYERWPTAASSGNGGVICTLDTSSGVVKTITTKKNGGTSAAYLSYPCWSPDSAVIQYHAHDGSRSDLWQIASDGSGKAVNATNDGIASPENFPAWGW
jgi:Tol biopolymer transport system component